MGYCKNETMKNYTMKTKTYLTIIILTFGLFKGFSQNYDSLVVYSKLWSNLSGGLGGNRNECCRMTTFLKFAFDTSINTIDEKQVLESTDSMKTWEKIGTIKESNKKIYFRDLKNNQGLLYDFSAKKGDSLKLVNYSNGLSDTILCKVMNIDTLDYYGIKRKRISLSYDYSLIDNWIEGIGSENGLLNPCIFIVGGFRELLCVHKNTDAIYLNTKRNTCYIKNENVGFELFKNPKIRIYPNPTSGEFIIDGIEITQGIELSIYNTSGLLIQKQNLLTKNIKLNLEKGFYILILKMNNEIIFKQKILID